MRGDYSTSRRRAREARGPFVGCGGRDFEVGRPETARVARQRSPRRSGGLVRGARSSNCESIANSTSRA